MAKIIEIKGEDISLIKQIASLEEIVLNRMIQEGKEGQLFTTGEEDILEYAKSDKNTVMAALDEKGSVEAAAYITQGQQPFTYNDITKYFKSGANYREYVKSLYPTKTQYKQALIDTYKMKIIAFEQVQKRILQEHPEFTSIGQYLGHEVNENGFHEKSELREKINRYMSEYIIQNYGEEGIQKYEQFYWITAEDISQEFNRSIINKNENAQGHDEFLEAEQEYETVLQRGQLKIYEQPNFDESIYYSANTDNSIELDTYITNPENRNAGLARIIVYEGIKKHMTDFFKNPKKHEIFLCSTLHRDNLSSKYVSEFFGLKDSLFVNRRQGRDREVHICRISREKSIEYLSEMSDKLAVLYGYNPNQKHISDNTRKKILEEQLQYEIDEVKRINTVRTHKKLTGNIDSTLVSKQKKIERLRKQIEKIPIGEKKYE